jgi:monoterpene epsilon-lactone hydrolase
VIRPNRVSDGPDTPIYLDIHGGALILAGGDLCRLMATGGALSRDMITWAIDYRMPPIHPYPAALDDCMATYRRALEVRSPEDVFVGGGSAGGNLAAALLLRAKDEGLPMPAALVLRTPEVDLTESGDSFHTVLGIDPVLKPLMHVNRLYANGHDLAHPYLSPLFGDVTGFPPTFLQTGTRDLFLSNTVRMHRKLRSAGVETELHVFEAMPSWWLRWEHARGQGTERRSAALSKSAPPRIDAELPWVLMHRRNSEHLLTSRTSNPSRALTTPNASGGASPLSASR